MVSDSGCTICGACCVDPSGIQFSTIIIVESCPASVAATCVMLRVKVPKAWFDF